MHSNVNRMSVEFSRAGWMLKFRQFLSGPTKHPQWPSVPSVDFELPFVACLKLLWCLQAQFSEIVQQIIVYSNHTVHRIRMCNVCCCSEIIRRSLKKLRYRHNYKNIRIRKKSVCQNSILPELQTDCCYDFVAILRWSECKGKTIMITIVGEMTNKP